MVNSLYYENVFMRVAVTFAICSYHIRGWWNKKGKFCPVWRNRYSCHTGKTSAKVCRREFLGAKAFAKDYPSASSYQEIEQGGDVHDFMLFFLLVVWYE